MALLSPDSRVYISDLTHDSSQFDFGFWILDLPTIWQLEIRTKFTSQQIWALATNFAPIHNLLVQRRLALSKI
jgi:hypothetical protein